MPALWKEAQKIRINNDESFLNVQGAFHFNILMPANGNDANNINYITQRIVDYFRTHGIMINSDSIEIVTSGVTKVE